MRFNPRDTGLEQARRRWGSTKTREDFNLYTHELTRAGRQLEALILTVNTYPDNRSAWEELMLASCQAGYHVLLRRPSTDKPSYPEDFWVAAVRRRSVGFTLWTLRPNTGWWTDVRQVAGLIKQDRASVRLVEGDPAMHPNMGRTLRILECMREHQHPSVEHDDPLYEDDEEDRWICSRCFSDVNTMPRRGPKGRRRPVPAYQNVTAWCGKRATREHARAFDWDRNPLDEDRRRRERRARRDPSLTPYLTHDETRMLGTPEEQEYARLWQSVASGQAMNREYLDLVVAGARVRSGKILIRELLDNEPFKDWLTRELHHHWDSTLDHFVQHSPHPIVLQGNNTLIHKGDLTLDMTLHGAEDPEALSEEFTSMLEEETFAPESMIEVQADEGEEDYQEAYLRFSTPLMRHHLVSHVFNTPGTAHVRDALVEQMHRDRDESRRLRGIKRKKARRKKNPPPRRRRRLTRAQWDEIVRLLLDEGWTYKRASEHFGVSRQAVSAHMQGRPYALRIYRKRMGLREIR